VIQKLSPWVLALRRQPGSRARIFFFPYAGGSGRLYRGFIETLSPDVDALAVELPGRGDRFAEPRFERSEALMPVLKEHLRPYLIPPFAFFGHSMGATIAFELTRELRRAGLPQPVCLFASGRRAPHLPPRIGLSHMLSDADFKNRLRSLGGTPLEVLENEELLQVVMPSLRSDFALSETYEYVPGDPLDLPISVFGGSDDPETTREELEAWSTHSSQASKLRIFKGNHFFIHDGAAQKVMQAVNDDLAAVAAKEL